MKIKLKNTFGSVFCIIQLFFSVAVCLLIANDASKPEHYSLLWILPITYGIFAFGLTAHRPECWEDFRFLIIAGLFFVRNSLTPFFMYLGDYKGTITNLNNSNVNKSLAIMIYEMIVVIWYAIYAIKKYPLLERTQKRFLLKKNGGDTLLLLVLSTFCIGTIAINPSYMLDFVSIFSGRNIRLTSIGANTSGAWYTIFVMLFPITYTFFCVYMMRIINKATSSFVRTLLNIILIIIPLLFMNNSDAFNLICSLCIALVAMYNGGISKKTFVTLVSIGVGAVVVFLFFMITDLSIEMSRNTTIQNISIDLQAYFPGVCNLAGIFNIGDEYGKATTLFYDIYSVIPFRNTLFRLTENHSLTVVWQNYNGVNSQILPCIGHLYYYIGIFAPIGECLLIKIAFKIFKMMRFTNGVFMYFARCMCFIFFIITPVMYNYCILFSRFFITILPMYVFAMLVEGKRDYFARRAPSVFN